MPKNPPKAKTVTERDLRLMRWIGTNGIASFKQLHNVFWTTAKERTCQERLIQLEKAGWIERHYVHTSRKRGEQVYTLTRQGANQHFEAATRRRLMVGLPARAELKQQLTAQDTRIALERTLAAKGKRVVDWMNERELRSEAAYSKRKAGSRTWGSLAEVADARIFISGITGSAVTNEGLKPPHGETRGRTGNSPNNSNSLLPVNSQDSADEAIQSVDIEIDGQYYGQMLRNKISTLARRNQPTIWVTKTGRVGRIESEIRQAGATNIGVMVVDELV